MKKILINDRAGAWASSHQDIKACIKKILSEEKVDGVVSVTLCDDKFIRRLNKQYRKKDCATDVLSFTMGEDNLWGDIIISIETAKRQAKEYGVSLPEELKRLAVHGTLHLLGYTHREMKMRDEGRKIHE